MTAPSNEPPGDDRPGLLHQLARDRADTEMLDSESLEMVATSVVVEEVVYEVRATAPTTHPDITVSAVILDRVRSLVGVMVLATFVLTFIVQPFRIPSESMERTLLVGDFLLVNKIIYSPPGHWGWLLPYRDPQRGDIVVFHFPLDPDDHVVKRLIGERGDRLHMRNGIVFRDGAPLSEPYTKQAAWSINGQEGSASSAGQDPFRDNFPSSRFSDPGVDAHWWMEMQHDLSNGDLLVPQARYFVMGDNRDDSRDSRYWGFVPRVNMVGMPILIYFSVREPSRTYHSSMPESMQDDRLGNSVVGRLLSFARWERTLRVVQ